MVGLAKSGLEGGALIAIPFLAVSYGARASSGLLLGIMITADLVAVWHYKNDADLGHLKRLLPWAMIGLLLGVIVGGAIPERSFRTIMTSMILFSAVIMIARELYGKAWTFPEKWWAAAPLGLLAGFASMVGNAAGPVMGLYLLSSGLMKGNIVGTGVWFFFLVNLIKVPFHIFSWHTFTTGTLLADLVVVPVTILATVIGVRIVRLIPEKPYRLFLIVVAMVGGLYLGLR